MAFDLYRSRHGAAAADAMGAAAYTRPLLTSRSVPDFAIATTLLLFLVGKVFPDVSKYFEVPSMILLVITTLALFLRAFDWRHESNVHVSVATAATAKETP